MHPVFYSRIHQGPVTPVRYITLPPVTPRLRAVGGSPVRAMGGDLWDVVSGAEAARARDLQARIEALNARRVTEGKMTQAQADAANAAVAADDPDTYVAQVGEAFVEGAKEGQTAEIEWVGTVAEKIVETPTKLAVAAAESAARGLFGNLPWWVWVGAGVAVLWWTGIIGPDLFRATKGVGAGLQRRGAAKLRSLGNA